MPDGDQVFSPFELDCAPPFLAARFFVPQRSLGWSLLHPGFAPAEKIVWLQADDGELRPDVDPVDFLREKLVAAGHAGALGFLTARDIHRHHLRSRTVEKVAACCLATVGLLNGERVGQRRRENHRLGTINLLVCSSVPLTDGALVEALSIATQARTAAVIETRPPEGPAITGTGTDCIVVAAPAIGEKPQAWAGLHTAVGEAIGAAVFDAVREGARLWNEDFARWRAQSEKKAP